MITHHWGEQELSFHKGQEVWVRAIVTDTFAGDAKDGPGYTVFVNGRLGHQEYIPLHADDVVKLDAINNTTMVEALFVQLAEPGVMLDIGCNHGLYLEKMAAKATVVIAFEPHPDNVNIINKLVTEKNLQEKVEVVQAALLNRNDDMQLFIHESNAGGHSIILDSGSGEGGLKPDRSITVPGRTLDSYGFKGVTAAKIDVESAELVVWEGARETFTTNKMYIELETHHRVDLGKLYKLIKEYGYKVFNDDKNEMKEVTSLEPDRHYILNNH